MHARDAHHFMPSMVGLFVNFDPQQCIVHTTLVHSIMRIIKQGAFSHPKPILNDTDSSGGLMTVASTNNTMLIAHAIIYRKAIRSLAGPAVISLSTQGRAPQHPSHAPNIGGLTDRHVSVSPSHHCSKLDWRYCTIYQASVDIEKPIISPFRLQWEWVHAVQRNDILIVCAADIQGATVSL
jgi:hypothetical protein